MKKAEVIRTIRNGALKVEVRHFADGRYGFDWQADAYDRRKVRLHGLEDAVARAKELLGSAQTGRLDRQHISDEQFAAFLRWQANQRPNRTVPEVVRDFLAAKRTKGRSHWTMRDLTGALDAFALRFTGPISDLTRRDVERWLDARNVGDRRWNNLLAAIIALMRFARRDGCLSAELSQVERIEKRSLKRSRVPTYSPAELRAYLAVVPSEWQPAITLGAFCGIRPEEVCPDPVTGKPALCWEHFLWRKNIIDLPADVSKVGERRFIPLSPTALAWLSPLKATGPVVPRRRLANYSRHWKVSAKTEWKNDGWRHSYASYRLAQTLDMPALALEMGNSVAIIKRAYLDLKHADEAQEWFAVLPQP